LLAPSDGVVAKKEVVVGEMVSPGQSVVSVVDPESVYLEAMVDETHIQHVKRGEPVRIEIDAYPGRTFEGHVSEVGVATGSEFALIPQNNASGNFTKVVQRLPVKIALENPDHMLKPGMSAVVAIDVREKH
jgi:membrane fusion protein (multidrug efflux system)